MSEQTPRMYLIVRSGLKWSDRVVQVAHAAVDAALCWHGELAFDLWFTKHKTMVVYGVTDKEFDFIHDELVLEGPAIAFEEPDLCDTATAIAVYPCTEKEFAVLLEMHPGLDNINFKLL